MVSSRTLEAIEHLYLTAMVDAQNTISEGGTIESYRNSNPFKLVSAMEACYPDITTALRERYSSQTNPTSKE